MVRPWARIGVPLVVSAGLAVSSVLAPASAVHPAATAADPVLAAVGDIACAPGAARTATTCQQAATAALAKASDITAVQTLGDNQYYDGTSAQFAGGYAVS